MIVVAGPAGAGKSTLFPLRTFGIRYFSVDERCARLHGSFVGIPPQVRAIAARECEARLDEWVRDGVSFAVETTLRTRAAVEQARRAQLHGFETWMLYVGSAPVETNIRRIAIRGLAGLHSSPEADIRAIYRASLENLPEALRVIRRVDVYDNSSDDFDAPTCVLRARGGSVTQLVDPLPEWAKPALTRR